MVHGGDGELFRQSILLKTIQSPAILSLQPIPISLVDSNDANFIVLDRVRRDGSVGLLLISCYATHLHRTGRVPTYTERAG